MEVDTILSYVRGIDLSNCQFENNELPEKLSKMSNLRWLKLDKTSLSKLPPSLSNHMKLEFVSITGNNISSIEPDIIDQKSIKVINLRRNIISNNSFNLNIQSITELLTLDLSYNNLTKVPDGLQNATKLLVLNLSNNKIEEIPSEIFINLNELNFLDLSANQLSTVPPQLRRLKNLKILDLSDNSLEECIMRPLTSLINLRSLNIKNTKRNINNIPSNLDTLIYLTELDISNNNLVHVPEAVYRMSSLKRLNLSHNSISRISNLIDSWSEMTSLNLSFNNINQLPATIDKLVNLVRLNLNGNKLTFSGIPSTIGNLQNLQYFLACFNCLEAVPIDLFRCIKLKEISLKFNQLTTIPVEIYQLTNLEIIDVKDNDKFVMPARPPPAYRDIYDDIDFSYQNILKLTIEQTKINSLNKQPTPTEQENQKDTTKKELKQLVNQKKTSNKNIMNEIGNAEEKKARKSVSMSDKVMSNPPAFPNKNIEIMFEKPNIDYSDIFNFDFAREEGVTVFIIENFLPCLLEETLHGKFYENDCYLVLHSYLNESLILNHSVFFWIGKTSTIDKKASAAIHAVNLRNFLNANQRIRREEDSSESDEFIALFYGKFNVLPGGTPCGFNIKEQKADKIKLYCAYGDDSNSISLLNVELAAESLDCRHVFYLETPNGLFLWFGSKSRYTIQNKTRLVVDKINNVEYKSSLEIIIVDEVNPKTKEFYDILNGRPSSEQNNKFYDEITKKRPFKDRFYKINLGHGYLELPQISSVDPFKNRFDFRVLETKSVYILDCFSDVFVWIGKKAPRLLRFAAHSLSESVFNFFKRPSCASIESFMEGNETIVFKSKFDRWMDPIVANHNLPIKTNKPSNSNSIQSKWKQPTLPSNSNSIAKPTKQLLPIDVKSMFFTRQKALSPQECEQYINSVNEDLSTIECFVMEKDKFVRLADNLKGHFYSSTCYVFLCRYYAYDEEEDEEPSGKQDYEYNVYFWEGRNCPKIGWLTFNFGLERKFRELIRSKLEVMRFKQQQEPNRLLSHFHKKFVIHRGLPTTCFNRKQFFQIRDTCGPITRRCVEINLTSKLLNSEFCYILKDPSINSSETETSNQFKPPIETGSLYFWVGRFANSSNRQLIDLLFQDFLPGDWTKHLINEGEEPDEFWQAIGGKLQYFTTAQFVDSSRLFRCSCELGHFTMSEKCSDFSQDDLIEEDAFILDTGNEIYVWYGKICSNDERKVSLKMANTYYDMLVDKKMTPLRQQPKIIFQGKEPVGFIQCFQGWINYDDVTTFSSLNKQQPTKKPNQQPTEMVDQTNSNISNHPNSSNSSQSFPSSINPVQTHQTTNIDQP